MTSTTPITASPWTGRAQETEQQWLRLAAEVAAELNEGAADRDRAGAGLEEALALVRAAGLADLIVPAEHGGRGAHWETAFGVLRHLAQADASLGLVVGYSYLNQACIGFYGEGERRAAWFRRTAERRWFWSDSLNPVSPDLRLTADGQAYRLTGRKRFATGASAADVILASAVAEGGAYDGQALVFAIDARRDGVRHLDDWDHLGMRATASGSVEYHDVLVTDEDVIGTDTGHPFSSIVTPGVQLLFGNLYLAVAQGALATARTVTRARQNAWFLSAADRYADDPLVHRLFGELVARTAAVEALADRLNRRYDDVVALGHAATWEDRARIEVEVAALKVVATEVGLEVSARVFEATGASATSNRVGLDRFWRDVRTHSLHDPVDYKKVEVGAHFLNGTVQPVSLYT
ncbi:acyl-CoA dehydrogenase family protein [Amnibacterium sp. CER49]|uniref:acyl-CoA dehydrogenase family protein n=1 Tax=Amnibacterium sp. CER49 TaxID=3039161 RepID=UPI00244B47CC|nr:acyl-CoA dehydrogenase family protein [Amnibacterium sp. CER49]MDH2442569.1 acyl-CoA dehydrogenase family protein [Amnibacterium sp. CER49]